MLTMLFRFLKVMFSGFAALLWVAAILCFVATAIHSGRQLGGRGEKITVTYEIDNACLNKVY